MWVVTVFEQGTFRIFEYETKEEALFAMEQIKETAIVSFTNWNLAA